MYCDMCTALFHTKAVKSALADTKIKLIDENNELDFS